MAGVKNPPNLPAQGEKVFQPKEKQWTSKLAPRPRAVYTAANEVTSGPRTGGVKPPLRSTPHLRMLEHLISAEFDPVILSDGPDACLPLEKATPAQTIDAQVATADWLKDMGLDDDKVQTAAETQTARAAFATLTTGSTPASIQTALTNMQTPKAVQHLVTMLTAYDWEFVNRAKELRGYAVAKILEDCENPNPNVRLKALGLLGKVTEIGLFTEKIEVKKVEMSDNELEQRIKDKLNRFMQVVDVVDVSTVDVLDES